MLKLAIFLLTLAFLPLIVTAQDQPPLIKSGILGFPLPDRVPITVENADQVVELARIGSGMIAEERISSDGWLHAYASSLGVWLYDRLLPEHQPLLLPVDTPITSVAISDTMIAGGDETGNIHLWNRATLEPLGVVTNHLYAVRGVAFNADGSRLASADQSGVARLWNVENQTELATVALPNAALDDVIFDGENLVYLKDVSQPEFEHLNVLEAFVSYNLLWQIEANTIERLPEIHRQAHDIQVREAISFPGLVAPTEIAYPLIGIVFPRLPKAISFGLPYTDQEGLTLWFLPDEGRDKGMTEFFELALLGDPSGRPSGDFLNPYTGLPPSDPDRASNEEFLAVAGDSSRITLTPVGSSESFPTYLFGHTRGIPSITLSPTDSRLLISASLDTTLRLWDVTAPPDTPSLTVLEGHQSGVASVDINVAGDLIASASYDGTIRLWGIPHPNS